MQDLRYSGVRICSLLTLAFSVLFLTAPAQAKPPVVQDDTVEKAFELRAKLEHVRYLIEHDSRELPRDKGRAKGAKDRAKKAQVDYDKKKKEYDDAVKLQEEKTKEVADAKKKADASKDPADVAQLSKLQGELSGLENKTNYAKRYHDSTLKVLNRYKDEEKLRTDNVALFEKRLPQSEKDLPKLEEELKRVMAATAKAEAARLAKQSPQPVAKKIDALIDQRLTKEKIKPSSDATDAEFLRRVTLDITGMVPAYEDVVTFLNDEDPDKRAKLIDGLLAKETYGVHFANFFCDMTTARGDSTVYRNHDHFERWLADSIYQNRRWHRIVSDMLGAEGRVASNPGGIFITAYRDNHLQPDPAKLAGVLGEQFMGLNIGCAQCHDHPFVGDWSQDDFWQMAAFFARVRVKDGGKNSTLPDEYIISDQSFSQNELVRAQGGIPLPPPPLTSGQISITDPSDPDKSLRVVKAKFLKEDPIELPEKGFYRKDLIDWLTSTENPFFARATVNQVWAHFFARGLVNPVYAMSPDNPASHPELLEYLEQQFIASGYDMKHLIRCITNSKAYQRTSRPTAENKKDYEYFSHMAIKTLNSTVLLDSLQVATGRGLEKRPGENRRKGKVFATKQPGSDITLYTHSIPQALVIMNAYGDGGASQVSKCVNRKEPKEAIESLYMSALARRPTEEESELMIKMVTEKDPKLAISYRDVYWVLINSAEFLVNR